MELTSDSSCFIALFSSGHINTVIALEEVSSEGNVLWRLEERHSSGEKVLLGWGEQGSVNDTPLDVDRLSLLSLQRKMTVSILIQ